MNFKYLLAVILFVVIGCTENNGIQDPLPTDELRFNISNSDKPQTSNATAQISTTDWSGLVTTEIFYEDKDYPPNNPNGYVQVPSDFVLVGGGAMTFETNTTSGGGYLTESRPDWANNRWYAASKDHKVADPHKLRVYGIGLKIAGVSPATLRSAMNSVPPVTSFTGSHPNTFAYMPSNYKLIGGGAKANYNAAGSLLVFSYPDGQSWNVKSKDHHYPDPSTITAWAIGIQENIPGFGFIDVLVKSGNELSPSGLKHVTVARPAGYVLTCVGGREDFGSGAGRMLVNLIADSEATSEFASIVSSKDNTYHCNGRLYGYTVWIRKRP